MLANTKFASPKAGVTRGSTPLAVTRDGSQCQSSFQRVHKVGVLSVVWYPWESAGYPLAKRSRDDVTLKTSCSLIKFPCSQVEQTDVGARFAKAFRSPRGVRRVSPATTLFPISSSSPASSDSNQNEDRNRTQVLDNSSCVTCWKRACDLCFGRPFSLANLPEEHPSSHTAHDKHCCLRLSQSSMTIFPTNLSTTRTMTNTFLGRVKVFHQKRCLRTCPYPDL